MGMNRLQSVTWHIHVNPTTSLSWAYLAFHSVSIVQTLQNNYLGVSHVCEYQIVHPSFWLQTNACLADSYAYNEIKQHKIAPWLFIIFQSISILSFLRNPVSVGWQADPVSLITINSSITDATNRYIHIKGAVWFGNVYLDTYCQFASLCQGVFSFWHDFTDLIMLHNANPWSFNKH